MKLSQNLKRTVFIIFGLMYISGTSQWLLKTFFQNDNGFGPETPPIFIWILRFHGTTSVALLILFGYLLREHLLPSWKIGRHKKSGLFLSAYLFSIISTLPFLMYLTDENKKFYVEQIHAYLGLSLFLPFAVHLLTKKKSR